MAGRGGTIEGNSKGGNVNMVVERAEEEEYCLLKDLKLEIDGNFTFRFWVYFTDSTSFPSTILRRAHPYITRYTRGRSSILVIGLNVHTAPIEIQEKFFIPEAQWPQAISDLCVLNHIEEAAVLITCNRMEIYVAALSQRRGVKEVTEWMSKISGVPVSELCQHWFLLSNKGATRHLFDVFAGLDSLVLGETQILAQVKQVLRTGQGVSGFGRKISGLFKHAIKVGKRVRTETNISSGSVYVSSVAFGLALTKIPESSYASVRVLVVGAGKMGKLVIKHLVANGCTRVVVVNRTEGRVTSIREELKNVEVIYRPLSEMLAYC